MCRSIKTLRGLDHPVAEQEVRAAALQYVRKISGYRQPSQINAISFDTAVEEIAAASAKLLRSLKTRSV